MKFNLGDLVGLYFTEKKIKLGVIIDSKKHNFIVKWIWYDKLFFMDGSSPVFEELNSQYLLNETTYERNHKDDTSCLKNLSYGF
jgi:hypothetical protein